VFIVVGKESFSEIFVKHIILQICAPNESERVFEFFKVEIARNVAVLAIWKFKINKHE
jgi:hypothetical protein